MYSSASGSTVELVKCECVRPSFELQFMRMAKDVSFAAIPSESNDAGVVAAGDRAACEVAEPVVETSLANRGAASRRAALRLSYR